MLTPRSALFVPADRPERHQKAFDSGAAAVIVDLKDAVAASQKDAARRPWSRPWPRAAARPPASSDQLAPCSRRGGPTSRHWTRCEPKASWSLRPDLASVETAAAGLPIVALIETAPALAD